MADHRAEQILDKLLTLLTGLTTTAARVYRGRQDVLTSAQVPALLIYAESDVVVDKLGNDVRDCVLTVTVEGIVQANATQTDQLLNLIRKEAAVALQADQTLGLAWVHDIDEGNAVYALGGEGELKSGSIKTTWGIMYRRSRTDPSA